MFKRFCCGFIYRNFSKTNAWKNLEKAKSTEKPSMQQTGAHDNASLLDTSMTIVPTEFDKRLLLWSGKYKSREEIPPRVRYETMDNAKSKVRIWIGNILMLLTVLACIGAVALGKKRQREGESLSHRLVMKEEELREEGRKIRNK